jgi:glucose-specific phosphotransferase system IIA component
MTQIQILAPVDGTVVQLESVPDEVFAQKLVGDGVAIEPSGSVAVAPASGQLAKLFEGGHAFGLELDNGVELIVHLGLDTIMLQGNGFEKLATEGQTVEAGQPIVRFDRATVERAGLAMVTPVVSSGAGEVVQHATGTVRAGQDVLFVVEV